MSRGTKSIAIVGMAARFPGARDLPEFWANLRDGVESIVSLSDEELLAAGVAPEMFKRADYVKAWPRFEGLADFDAEFFGYSAREAQVMDPQHRLFLETAWQALESSGYDPGQYDGRIGVFGGAGANRYLHHVHSHPDLVENLGQTRILLGNELGFLASRVSYKLNLTGPSVSLRTACSTSLVAVHTACRSLLADECDMALAGGVHVEPEEGAGYPHQQGSFLSPDGHVRPFDEQARGTVFGSGVGVVVLKRLEDALADRDTIHAIVKGSAVNNDGALKVGFTAPGVTGQSEVIGAALAHAGLGAADIDYVEAHGTGTALGDPIEVRALAQVFGASGSCLLGSVKGNIGHLDAAAGMAGLIKVVLALTHETIPPTINHTRANPDAYLDRTPFTVPVTPAPWPRVLGRPRRAGVSAFGFGGTNAHLLLEEAPEVGRRNPSPRPAETLLITAQTADALETATDQLATALMTSQPDLADAAYTLARGRYHYPYRRTVTGTDLDTATAALRLRDPAFVTTTYVPYHDAPVIFQYSGQGSQRPAMARELCDRHPIFRDTVDACAALLTPHLGADIREPLLTTSGDLDLDQTCWAQPALFVYQYAMTKLWKSWGISPTALLGHSLGEWTAACVAGIVDLPDILALLALRGRLMQERPPGAMLHVTADRVALEAHLPADLALAAHNGPRECVVSGTPQAIEDFTATARRQGWATRLLNSSRAFHSPHMQPVAEELAKALASTHLRAPQIPLVSNVTGTWITHEQATAPQYWAQQHTLATVEYAAGVRTATARPHANVLEIGPSHTLTALARRTLSASGTKAVTHTTHPHDDHTYTEHLHDTLHRLWHHGATPDWGAYYGREHRRRIPLPAHPLNRKRHWLTRRPADASSAASSGDKPRRRDDVADWFSCQSWQRTPLPADARPDSGQHWLVLSDELGVGAAIAGRLTAGGATVTVVEPAGSWSAPAPGRFLINAARKGDYLRLLSALHDGTADPPTRIVHAMSVTALDEAESRDAQAALRRGFDSLVYLAQALAQRRGITPTHLWVLSNGLHDVTGDERLSPLKATLLGPCRVLPREMATLGCRSVDLDYRGAPAPVQLDRLMIELAHEPMPRPRLGTEVIAHRGAHRWARHYLPLPLSPSAGRSAVREGGVYLVTGGTGALGLALAEHLAATGARVVLTARTALPPALEWDDWLSGSRDDGSSRVVDIVRRLAGLRNSGADLLVLRADVSDLTEMRGAVRQAAEHWGAINGVFHAAGVPGGGLIELKDLTTAADVMRPKVQGTLVLEEALAGQDLDFLVLFGSNGANIGSVGQVDYCAASCFLDAFAQDRGRRRRVISIGWAPWKDVGMAADSAHEDRMAHHGMSVMEGLRALEMVMAGTPEPQIIVSPVDVTETLAWETFLVNEPAQAEREESAAAEHARPDLPTDYVEPSNKTERAIRTVWQNLLGVDRIGVHDSFFALGGDSLIAIQAVNAVNARLETGITLGDLYEGLTIAHLAALADAPEQRPPEASDDDRDGEGRRQQQLRKRRQHQQRRRRTNGVGNGAAGRGDANDGHG
ncbi:beta-ketoacyl synthase N-terminal-like domain-containing protein [Nonomuraea sp. NPDC046802]|uniref:type I polyketide synthase n=1 Tax=Nonomuraea sp. NPDC046802 TaxID=3154919 RepID=UPI0033CDE05C